MCVVINNWFVDLKNEGIEFVIWYCLLIDVLFGVIWLFGEIVVLVVYLLLGLCLLDFVEVFVGLMLFDFDDCDLCCFWL